MSNAFIDLAKVGPVHLEALGGLTQSVHVIDKKSIDALNAALAARRPLLVRGEPGTGKSQLARAAAVLLERNFVAHAVDARTETRDLLYTVDAVARLAAAQLMGAMHKTDADTEKRVHVSRFITPGPIWWAFQGKTAAAQAKIVEKGAPQGWKEGRASVVLIDEIDKADSSVPNGLLDALGHGRFDVVGCPPVEMNAAQAPLLVLTTNEERAMPDAFLRRCFVLHLRLPDNENELVEMLVIRGRAHFPHCADSVLRQAAKQLAHDRIEHKKHDLVPPGLAEYVDLLRAVTELRPKDEQAQLKLLGDIAQFTFRKHPPEQMR